MRNYQIITDATADLNEWSLQGCAEVKTIPMEVEIGGNQYTYGPGGNLIVERFYDMQKNGHFATTSQINPSVYFEHFEPILRKGMDVLYLGFSSGMSGTFQSALMCAGELRAEYPERRIICIDTLCGSVGEGFLVREAAKKQAQGYTLDALAAWVEEHKLQVCHWFTVDVFDHLKHGGRVSSTAAVFGTILQIKPLLHIDNNGRLEVAEKPRGRKKAIAAQMERMRTGWTPEVSKLVVIGHGNNLGGAIQLETAVRDEFPDAEIFIADIGPIIGAHTGPGMLALIYWGDNR